MKTQLFTDILSIKQAIFNTERKLKANAETENTIRAGLVSLRVDLEAIEQFATEQGLMDYSNHENE